MITDRIHENHQRSIDGVAIQEFLHDILDSATGVTSGGEITNINVINATALPRDNFPGFYGLAFDHTSLYFCYLNEYYLPESSLVTGLLLRVVAPAVSETGSPLEIRVISDTNEYLGRYDSTLTSELQLIEFVLDAPASFEFIMIQYKSAVAFYVKEILLLNKDTQLP
jgi:hypothetical protein